MSNTNQNLLKEGSKTGQRRTDTEPAPLQVAISNQKGGAGKTTTTLNVGGALNQLGQDVLLVDLDPQGHLTEDCGFGDAYDVDGLSLHDVLVDLDQRQEINAIIQSHGEFDVLPSHVQLFRTASDLSSEIRREERLKMALEELEHSYDSILIDCPSNLGALTNNALRAAQNLLVPARPTSKSIKAIELLLEQRAALEDAYDTSIQFLGVVVNEVSTHNQSKEMVEWFDSTFGDQIPVYEIRSRVAIQRAADNLGSIFTHSEECDMAVEYLQIAEGLIKVRST